MKTWHETKPTNYSKVHIEGVDHWGAWISTKATPSKGDKVVIKTKAGELHTRIIGSKLVRYASGVIVILEQDADIAKKAQERYQAKIDENKGHVEAKKETKSYQPVAKSNYDYKVINKVCHLCGSVCYGDCIASR